MYSWGRCNSGQLSLGGIDDLCVSTPRRVKPPLDDSNNTLESVSSVGCGWEHTVIATENGEVYACGSNDHGQLGLPTGRKRFERVGALETKSVKQVSCGHRHTVALSTAGEVFTLGSNSDSQLGRITDEDCTNVPRLVKGSWQCPVVQVTCGDIHTLVLTADCQVFGWGSNSHHQVGLPYGGAHIAKPEHIELPYGVPVVQVVAGGRHSLALTVSGCLYSWGKNNFGQLGVGDDTDRPLPTLVTSLPRQHACYVDCGEDHSAILTKSGAVFTFGSSGNGQLGHSMQAKELRPKQVIELMGSKVIQIACGRQHTLALVKRSGRVYSWGLGGSGQLGLKSTKNFNSPCVVTSVEWASFDSPTGCVVKRICAGGDQSFVCVPGERCMPVDFRQSNPHITPSFLSQESLQQAIHKAQQLHNFVDLLRKLDIVLKSPSLINGSFLDSDEIVEDAMQFGVDMESVRLSFKTLHSIKVQEVEQKVVFAVASLVQSLVARKMSTEASCECFRVFLILPECELFSRPKHYCNLIGQLAIAFLNLDRQYKFLIGGWYQSLRPQFLERVVSVFRSCVLFILRSVSDGLTHETIRFSCYFETLVNCLKVLSFLSEINEQACDMISHEQFYVSELNESSTFSLTEDFVHWVNRKDDVLVFCRFPFIYSTQNKAELLKLDANLEMKNAVERAYVKNLHSLFSGSQWLESPVLVIQVRRDNLLRDTLDEIVRYCGEQQQQENLLFRKPLQVEFVGEEGQDAGGVKKEFFLLLMRELLNPDFGMFTVYEETQVTWFLENSLEELAFFHLVGTICGLAIYNSVLLHTNFPLAVYKKLLERSPHLADLKEMQPSLGKSLQDLLDYQEEDFEDMFGLNFQITRVYFGQPQTVDLAPDGANKPVTKANRQDYVEAYVDYLLNKSVAKQFSAFSTGFRTVCGSSVLQLIHPAELQAIVSGCVICDLRALEQVTEYRNGYYREHCTICNFWEIIHELGESLRKKFMIFLTGSERIPVTGLSTMKVYIQKSDAGLQNDRLPVAHTCFNILDLPAYSDKMLLRDKLIMAITQTEGFGLV